MDAVVHSFLAIPVSRSDESSNIMPPSYVYTKPLMYQIRWQIKLHVSHIIIMANIHMANSNPNPNCCPLTP